jgi:hypothetical protein
MGRTKVQVKSEELKEAIKLAEANGPFNTRQELAIAISSSQWGIDNNITTAVVINRIKEFGIVPLTQKGKRGRQTGEKLTDSHKQKLMDGRGKKSVDKSWIDGVRKITPAAYLPIVDRIEQGSLVATLKMKCLECCNFNKSEIKNCSVQTCVLWSRRPYK